MNNYKKSGVISVFVGAVLFAAPVLSSEEGVTLRFADWFPTSHHAVTQGAEVFIKNIDKLSNGQIKVQYFPSQQIGKAADMLSLAQTGLPPINWTRPIS